MGDLTRRATAAVTAAVLTATLAGCTTQPATPNSNLKPEKSSVTVSCFVGPPCVAFHIAMTRGFFKDEGLDVKPAVEPAIRFDKFKRGEFDFHLDNNVQILMAQAEGFDVSIVAENDLADRGLLVISTIDPNIRSVQDLKGKRIGIDVRGNFIELMATVSLAVRNIDAKEVKFVPIPIPEMPKAMTTKKVDAAWLSAGFAEQMEAKGARRILDLISGPTASWPTTSFVTTRQFAEQNPRTVAAFNRAIVKAQRIRDSNLDAYYDAVSKVLGIPRQAANALPPAPGVSTTNPVRLQRVADTLLRFGFIKKKIEAKDLIAPSIRQTLPRTGNP